MSRAAALATAAAVVALAACKVDSEGAACTAPGGTGECPTGQACGNDLRCSVRALSCADRCDLGARRCSGVDVQACTSAADPVCGTWTVALTCQGGLVCADAAAERCDCPAAGPVFTVDPLRPSDASVTPTGAAAPPACRLDAVAPALATAGTWATAHGAARVEVAGTPAPGSPVTVAIPGDLEIPGGVTLAPATASPAPSDWVLEGDGTGTAATLVVHAGAAVTGFTVSTATSATTAPPAVVTFACSASADPAAQVSNAIVDASKATVGVDASAACAAALQDVRVQGAAGAALSVSGGDVTFSGGALVGSGLGVDATQGTVTLDGAEVSGNAQGGMILGDLSGTTAAAVRDCRVIQNGGTGIVALNDAALVLTGNVVWGNAGTSWQTVYYSAGSPPTQTVLVRLAGGIVLRGTPPPTFTFAGNRIFKNGGDQALVYQSSATWNLGGTSASCSDATLLNVLACYDPTSAGSQDPYRGLVAVGVGVGAIDTAWANELPTAQADFKAYGVNASGMAYTVQADPACAPVAMDCASTTPP